MPRDDRVGRIEQLTTEMGVKPLQHPFTTAVPARTRQTSRALTQAELAAVIPAAFDAVWEKRLKDDERMASALAEEIMKRLPPVFVTGGEEA